MNAIEQALRIQELRLTAAQQRLELARHAQTLAPVFQAADRVRAGVRWAGKHPQLLAGALAFSLIVRPGVRRFFWRWGRRAFVAWRVWRHSERWLGALPTGRARPAAPASPFA